MHTATSDALVPGTSPSMAGDPSPPTTDDLAHQLRRGSRTAMSAVFAEHVDTIYNYCYRRTGSWSVAEDLTSAVFLEVWRGRGRVVEQMGSILPWLYGVATNVCRNHARSQRRQAGAFSRLQLLDGTTPDDAVDDQVAGRIDADRRVRTALDRLAQLPAADQDVFVLVCWEGLSYPQAAQALDIPIGTVRSRLARVRRQLRLADASPTPSGDADE